MNFRIKLCLSLKSQSVNDGSDGPHVLQSPRNCEHAVAEFIIHKYIQSILVKFMLKRSKTLKFSCVKFPPRCSCVILKTASTTCAACCCHLFLSSCHLAAARCTNDQPVHGVINIRHLIGGNVQCATRGKRPLHIRVRILH